MSELSASFEKIADHPRGPLIAVNFSGIYPPGSAGNEFARAMVEFLRSALAETRACGVVLDLTQLDYVWGDAIGGLAMPLLAEREMFRPVAIVATGRTARALKPLLGPNFLMGVAAMQLAETKQQALSLVQEALARGPSSLVRAPVQEPRAAVAEVVPCCSVDNASRVRDLEHFYGFDFDLFECPKCGRYWVWAWYEGTNRGGWEEIDQEEGSRLRTLPEPQLRPFMKVWARKFD